MGYYFRRNKPARLRRRGFGLKPKPLLRGSWPRLFSAAILPRVKKGEVGAWFAAWAAGGSCARVALTFLRLPFFKARLSSFGLPRSPWMDVGPRAGLANTHQNTSSSLGRSIQPHPLHYTHTPHCTTSQNGAERVTDYWHHTHTHTHCTTRTEWGVLLPMALNLDDFHAPVDGRSAVLKPNTCCCFSEHLHTAPCGSTWFLDLKAAALPPSGETCLARPRRRSTACAWDRARRARMSQAAASPAHLHTKISPVEPSLAQHSSAAQRQRTRSQQRPDHTALVTAGGAFVLFSFYQNLATKLSDKL
jgi:hypothetical protein